MRKKKTVETVFDYIDRNNEPLSLDNFNEIDTVIFSTLCLIDVSYCIPSEKDNFSFSIKDAIERQLERHGENKLGAILPIDLTKYVVRCGFSNRYKNIRVHDLYSEVGLEEKTQSTFFLADLDETTSIVLFGSTDDTIVGWYEDLKLIEDHNLKCLKKAYSYVIRHFDPKKKYIFIGHSKGGLECAYVYMTLPKEIQDHVLIAYDLDGPGFTQSFIKEHENKEYLNRLILICPEQSFVGRLFYQPVNSIVVYSTAKGLLQHSPDSWAVNKNQFMRLKRFSKRAGIKAAAANHYVASLNKNKAKNIVNGILKIASAGNKTTLTALLRHPFAIIKGIFSLTKAERHAVITVPFGMLKQQRKEKEKM